MRILLLLAAASLTCCAATAPPPLDASHPASPKAVETPIPEISRALGSGDAAARPPEATSPPEGERGTHHAH
jgi:hypothetical protein